MKTNQGILRKKTVAQLNLFTVNSHAVIPSFLPMCTKAKPSAD